MIRGGDWPSTVAGECVTHFRLALYPGERVADRRQRVEQTVASVGREQPALARHRIEVLYDGFQCEWYELEHDAPLVTGLLDAATRATGRRPPLFASTATTDARSFQLYGDTPAVCFGPLAENEHGVDERVFVPSAKGIPAGLRPRLSAPPHALPGRWSRDGPLGSRGRCRASPSRRTRPSRP